MNVNGMSGIFANQSFPTDRGVLIFGRNATACNIVFPEEVRGISRTHCKIEQNGKVCTITDLGSSYGTFVNGMKIQQYAPMTLKNGDTIYLGDKTNMFTFQSEYDNTPAKNRSSVTYLNRNDYPRERRGGNGALIAVIIILIMLLAGASVFGVMLYQDNLQKEQELYEEQNKGFVGNLFDTLEDGIELFEE